MMTFEDRIAHRIEHVHFNHYIARRRVADDLSERSWAFLRAVLPDVHRNEVHTEWHQAAHEAQWGDGFLVLMQRNTDVRWNEHPAYGKPKIEMGSGQYWRVGEKLRNALVNNGYAVYVGRIG